jgi:hypothetical protein
MSFTAVTKAFESSVQSRTDLLVLVSLAQRADPKTSECWPGIARISVDARIGRRAVFRALKRLEDAGHITRISGRGNHHSNRYRIHPVVVNGDTSLPESKVNDDTPFDDSKVNGGSPLRCTGVHPKGEPECTLKGNESSRRKNGRHEPKRLGKTEDIPLPFESEAFGEAWEDWKKHRRELGKKLTTSTQVAQLKKLQTMGEAAAIACIRQSIENGWQGLFPPKDHASMRPPSSVLGQPSLRLQL